MNDFAADYRTAVAALERGDADEALARFSALRDVGVADSRVVLGRGMALCRLGRTGEALADFQQALRLAPDDPEVAFAIADSLARAGQETLAEQVYRQLLAQCPDHLAAAHNLGTLLHDAERFADATAVYDAALARHPEDAVLARDLAQSEIDGGDLAAGLARLQALRARLAEAGDAEERRQTDFALALACLQAGRWDEAWPLYEARWLPAEIAAHRQRWGTPWQGETLAGRHLLVVAEQGFGDSLLFIRYLPALAAEAARLSLRVPEPLRELFARALAAWPNVDVASDTGEGAGHTCYTHLGSLPLHALSAHRAAPQLAPPPPLPLAPRTPPAPIAGDTRTVGLVWRGQGVTAALRRRSLTLEQLLPALPYRGLRYLSLQIDRSNAEWQLLDNFGIADPTPGIASFQDTADLLAGVDAVLCIDTAVAHLASGLGKPLFLLRRRSSEWRWGRNGADGAWYPRCTALPLGPRLDLAPLAAFGRGN